MKQTRREMLQQTIGAGAALAIPATNSPIAMPIAEPIAEPKPRIRIGVSTYSYWHFDKVKYPIEKVIENAARIGFDGVEILHRQMESEDRKYVNNLKKMAF